MTFELPPLPYPLEALEPVLSRGTLDYHYNKHHQTYVTNLNKLVSGTAHEQASLEHLILTSTGGIFNNAAQVWNHTFYWSCLTPQGKGQPSAALAQAINTSFGNFDAFKEKFSATALATFGSGWAWLVKLPNGELDIVSTSNAGNPMTQQQTPLLTCDVWEHAYYIDYRNARAKYVEAFWDLVNWDFVESCFNR